MYNSIDAYRTELVNATDDFLGAEEYLYATLKPVRPRPEFVQGLSRRLRGPMPPIKTSLQGLRNVILLTAGILSGLVFVITGVRALLLLLGRIKTVG